MTRMGSGRSIWCVSWDNPCYICTDHPRQQTLDPETRKRESLANLSPRQKANLMRNRQVSVAPTIPDATASPIPASPPTASSFISLSAGTSLGLTRLLPQITGTSTQSNASGSPSTASRGWGKRLSLASLGSWSAVSTPDMNPGSPNTQEDDGAVTPRADTVSLSGVSASESRPVEKQYTGGLWGWWSGSAKPQEGTAAHFVDQISNA
jgi:hypothetical protein